MLALTLRANLSRDEFYPSPPSPCHRISKVLKQQVSMDGIGSVTRSRRTFPLTPPSSYAQP